VLLIAPKTYQLAGNSEQVVGNLGNPFRPV